MEKIKEYKIFSELIYKIIPLETYIFFISLIIVITRRYKGDGSKLLTVVRKIDVEVGRRVNIDKKNVK